MPRSGKRYRMYSQRSLWKRRQNCKPDGFTVIRNKGIATVATLLHNAGIESSMKVNHFTTDALFSTITNANFDIESITGRIIKGLKLRNELIAIAKKEISYFPSSTN